MKKPEIERFFTITFLFLTLVLQNNVLSHRDFSILLLLGVFLSLVGLLDLGLGHQLFTSLIEKQQTNQESEIIRPSLLISGLSMTFSFIFPIFLGIIFFITQPLELGTNKYIVCILFLVTIFFTSVFSILSKVATSVYGASNLLRFTFLGSLVQLLSTLMSLVFNPSLVFFQLSNILALIVMILLVFLFCKSRIDKVILTSEHKNFILMSKMQLLQILQVASQLLFAQFLFSALNPEAFSQYQILSKIFLSISSILIAEKTLLYWRSSAAIQGYTFRLQYSWMIRHIVFGILAAIITSISLTFAFRDLPQPHPMELFLWLVISFCFSILQLVYFHTLGQSRFFILFVSSIFQVALPILGLLLVDQLSSVGATMINLIYLIIPILLFKRQRA
jgi:hypothetical protein